MIEGQLVLSVEDDGPRCNSSIDLMDQTPGERAMLRKGANGKNGSYCVNHYPGRGTVVEVRVPFTHPM